MNDFTMDELAEIARKADEKCVESDKVEDICFAWAYARLSSAADSLHAMLWRKNSSLNSRDAK